MQSIQSHPSLAFNQTPHMKEHKNGTSIRLSKDVIKIS